MKLLNVFIKMSKSTRGHNDTPEHINDDSNQSYAWLRDISMEVIYMLKI